jgi:hypothetical protein
MTTARYHETYFFSSDTAAGALNVSSDGTQFTVQLTDPIAIPAGAKACELGVVTAAIWNTSPNIGVGLGPGGVDDNKFRYTTSTAPAGTYDVTFPTGQYSIGAISSFLSSAFTNNGHAANLFTIGGQAATGLAIITILTNGDTAHFEAAGSIGSILGFAAAPIVAAIAGEIDYGTTQAQLNRVNTYLISSPNFIRNGIPTNANTAGLLAAVPITSAPGFLINYAATNVLWTPAQDIVGKSKTNFSFRLTNERNEATPTAGESWSFTIIIRYVK